MRSSATMFDLLLFTCLQRGERTVFTLYFRTARRSFVMYCCCCCCRGLSETPKHRFRRWERDLYARASSLYSAPNRRSSCSQLTLTARHHHLRFGKGRLFENAPDFVPHLDNALHWSSITGFISKPISNHGRGSNDRQFLYVNRRAFPSHVFFPPTRHSSH